MNEYIEYLKSITVSAKARKAIDALIADAENWRATRSNLAPMVVRYFEWHEGTLGQKKSFALDAYRFELREFVKRAGVLDG